MTKLTDHFTLEEMTKSQTAVRLGIDNEPPAIARARLYLLCKNELEPIRSLFPGSHIDISSGYRCPELNSRTPGSSSTSQHMKGEAADFTVHGVSNRIAMEAIIDSGIPYDQLIYEYGEQGWLHVSYSERPRMDTLEARRVNGKPKYLLYRRPD